MTCQLAHGAFSAWGIPPRDTPMPLAAGAGDWNVTSSPDKPSASNSRIGLAPSTSVHHAMCFAACMLTVGNVVHKTGATISQRSSHVAVAMTSCRGCPCMQGCRWKTANKATRCCATSARPSPNLSMRCFSTKWKKAHATMACNCLPNVWLPRW